MFWKLKHQRYNHSLVSTKANFKNTFQPERQIRDISKLALNPGDNQQNNTLIRKTENMSTPTQVDSQIRTLRDELEKRGFQVLCDADDIQQVLLSLCYTGNPSPVSVSCQLGPNLPPVTLEQFVPNDYLIHAKEGVLEFKGNANGTRQSVSVHAERNYGMSGDVISLVAVPKTVPLEALKSQFQSQVTVGKTPPRAHLSR